MHREVFAGRPDRLLTVGEMPGVTVEEARLFTDPARAEVDMVFQFEHVGLDQGPSKWDVRPLDLCDLKDRKSTRLNSSHANISYAVFCLQIKKSPLSPVLSGVS